MHDADRDRDTGAPPFVGRVMSSRGAGLARLFFGFALVMFGVTWTLEALGWGPAYEIRHWWPLLLVGYGAATLAGWGGPPSKLRGWFFITIGALLVLAHLVHVYVGFGLLWALVVMFAGLVLVTRSLAGGRRADDTGADAGAASDPDMLRLTAIMGAAIRRVTGQVPARGELFAVMGGIEVDLREAQPPAAPMVIDVFACAGGIELVVPETWRVQSDVVPIVGGVEDRTVMADDTATACTVVLRGTAFMGGVVVRNQPGADREVTIRRRRMRRDGLEEIHVSPLGVRIRRGTAGTETTGPAVPPGPQEPAAAGADPSAPPPPAPPPAYGARGRVVVEQGANQAAAILARVVLALVALAAIVWLVKHHDDRRFRPVDADAPPPASAPASPGMPDSSSAPGAR